MSIPPSSQIIDEHREYWADVAQKNGWYKEPFFVQVWADESGNIVDSVAHQGMTTDIIITPDTEYANCTVCGKLMDLDIDPWISEGQHYYCGDCR